MLWKKKVEQGQRIGNPERVRRPAAILNREVIRRSFVRKLHVSQDLKKMEERHRGTSQHKPKVGAVLVCLRNGEEASMTAAENPEREEGERGRVEKESGHAHKSEAKVRASAFSVSETDFPGDC